MTLFERGSAYATYRPLRDAGYISTFDNLPEAEYRRGLAELREEAAACPGRRLDAGMGWALIWGRRP